MSMSALWWCGLCLAASLLGASVGEEPRKSKASMDENGVIHLNNEAFDEETGEFKAILVLFHAPWCKECEEISKEIGKVAKELREASGLSAAVAMLDISTAGQIGERFYIRSLPVLKMFRDGRAYDYEGNYTADDFSKTVKKYASSSWEPPPENTVSLTTNDFESFVKGESATMVEFFAPWCQHCKQLAPQYEKAAVALKRLPKPLKLGTVDCIAEKMLCESHKITSYPTLRFYRFGRVIEYFGARSAEAIVEYMKARVGPASKELPADRVDISKYISSRKNEPAIVSFFPDKDDEAFEMYDVLTEELRDNFTFVHVFSSELGRSFGVKGRHGTILVQPKHLQSKYEPKVLVLTEFEADDKEGFTKWVKKSARPLVGHVHENNSATLYDWTHDLPVVFMYLDVDFGPSGLTGTQYWRNRLLAVAKDYKEKDILFALVDEGAAETQLKNMGFTDSTSDVFVAILSSKGKYPLHDDFSEDTLRDHIDAYLDRELKPYLRSETPPRPNKGPVKIVVGQTFDDLVRDVTKDVLVEFHAPWCMHCQKMDPVLKKVAKRFSKQKDIVIAKYNAIANDIPPGFDVPGFPTIYFKRKGSTTAEKYTMDRGFDDLVSFINKNAASLQTEKDLPSEKDEL